MTKIWEVTFVFKPINISFYETCRMQLKKHRNTLFDKSVKISGVLSLDNM